VTLAYRASKQAAVRWTAVSPWAIRLFQLMGGVAIGEAEVIQPLFIECAHTALQLVLQACGICPYLGHGLPVGVNSRL
jgi:hypothetical protein